MTSRELNEILNKTRRTPNISLTPEQVEELVTSLDELEKLKKLMGTPIQDIMKDLKTLKEIRSYLKVIDYGEKYQNRYALQVGNVVIPELKKETYDKWNRWLGNEN